MFGVELYLGSFTITFILGIITTIILYWFSTKNHDYWKKRGVPYPKPVPLVGNLLESFRKPTHEMDMDRFKKFGTVYGFYEGSNPILSVSDPKLIRDILVKDFAYFPTRRQVKTGNKIFDSMLTTVKGEDWKRIRSIVSPTFTTGKIKRVLGIFKDCSKILIQNFRTTAEEKKSVDVKRLYTAFTMDVIASSAFSTKLDSHNDPDNVFVKTANLLFMQHNWGLIILYFLAPRCLWKWLPIKDVFMEIMEFFKGVTLQIISERKREGQEINDFLQLLLETNKEEEKENQTSSNKDNEIDILSNYGEENVAQQIYKNVTSKKLSIDELVAQCIVFFIAGSETTSSTLSFATYLLAIHPDIQNQLREEVDRALEKTDGELTYEAIQGMKYLDNVISETLRLFPPALRLERRAESDYKLGDTGITVPKGMLVGIPTYVLHRDPNFYQDPEIFDPERFSPDQVQQRDFYSYLPFGAGPRNCVAMRFALMEIKICLAAVIASFDIKQCSQTKVPLEFRLNPGFLLPTDITVEIQVRQDCRLKN